MTRRPNHNFRRIAGTFALAGLLAVGRASGITGETQLFLRNGDRVTGSVLSGDTNRLTLSNSVLGVFSVPIAQIARRVQPSPPAPSLLPDAETQRRLEDARAAYVTGLLSSTEYHRQRARLLAQSALAQPATVAAVPLTPEGASAGPAAPAEARPAMKFSGELQAGLDLALANKDRQLYTGRLKLQHAYDRVRNTADYLFTYGRTDGELSANRMDGTLKSDYDLNDRIYAYSQGNAGYDEIRRLDNYWQIGPGAGWRAITGTNLAFNLEAGINFQEQNRTDGTATDVVYYRLAEQGRWNLNSRFSLDQKLEYFPQWDDISEYKLRFEITLRLWLHSNLSLNLTLIDIYDTMTAQGVEPNDLQIRSTLGVRF